MQVNLVNADLLAKKRGLRIVETVVPSDGDTVLKEIEVRGCVGGLVGCWACVGGDGGALRWRHRAQGD